MNAAYSRGHGLLARRNGRTAIEYAVMAALIIVVCFVAIKSIGTTTIGSFGAFGATMSVLGGSGS